MITFRTKGQRGFLFLATALLAVACFSGFGAPKAFATDGPNLVANPSLETGTTNAPDSWNQGNWGTNTTVFTYPVLGSLGSGTKAAEVTVSNYTDGDAKWFFNDVPVTAAQAYSFSDVYKSTVASAVVLRYTMTDGTFQYVELGSVAAASDWTPFSTTFTPPTGVVSATVFHLLRANGTLDIDDVALFSTTVSPPPPPTPGVNLILNPSLETGTTNAPNDWNEGNWGTNSALFTYPVAGQNGSSAAEVTLSNYTNGDAKWFFNDVAVNASSTYQFSDFYKSTASSTVVVRYADLNGVFTYDEMATLPTTSDWQEFQTTITPPAGTASLTVFHLLRANGTLDIDNDSLVVATSTGSGGDPSETFDKGYVTLSFDDGWTSQYTNVVPILSAAGLKGSFYIITNEMDGVTTPDMIGNDSFETAASSSPALPVGWSEGNWGTNTATFTYPIAGQSGNSAAEITMNNYTDGDAKWYFDDVPVMETEAYVFSDWYKATVPTDVVARFAMSGGSYDYVDLGTPAASASWTPFVGTFTAPAGATSVTIFHLIQSNGTLDVDTYRLDGLHDYMNTYQVQNLQAAGEEVGDHTETHPSLISIPHDQAVTEIDGAQTDLAAAGITPDDTFVYPYGDYDADVESIVQDAGFIGARTTTPGYNTKSTDPYALLVQNVDNTTTAAEMDSWIDTAVANKTWLVIVFHQVDESGEEYATTPEILQSVVNYLTQNNTPVITMHDGLTLMGK